MSQTLESPKAKIITEILDEPILQNQLVKPSEILRLIAMEGRYKWVTRTVDVGDGIHRCALGAIYGFLGWKGYGNGEGYIRADSFEELGKYINKTTLLFGGNRSELGELAYYNNQGHDYLECADWLEARGF